MTVLYVALGAAVGANARYLIDRRVQQSHDSTFPWGTLTVNVIGSFILGFLAGLTLLGFRSSAWQALIGTGFCGALTTFSTFGYETVRLLTDRARMYAVANVVISVLAGFGSSVLGMLLAAAWQR